MLNPKFAKSFIKQEMWDGWDGSSYSSDNFDKKKQLKKYKKYNSIESNFTESYINKLSSEISLNFEQAFDILEADFEHNFFQREKNIDRKSTALSKKSVLNSVASKIAERKEKEEILQHKIKIIAAAIQNIKI